MLINKSFIFQPPCLKIAHLQWNLANIFSAIQHLKFCHTHFFFRYLISYYSQDTQKEEDAKWPKLSNQCTGVIQRKNTASWYLASQSLSWCPIVLLRIVLRAAADEPDTRICIYFWQNLWKWSKVTGVIHARASNLEEAAI